jgi:hypothetical protein
MASMVFSLMLTSDLRVWLIFTLLESWVASYFGGLKVICFDSELPFSSVEMESSD